MYYIDVNICSGVNRNKVCKVTFIKCGTYIGVGISINSRWGQWYPEWGKGLGICGFRVGTLTVSKRNVVHGYSLPVSLKIIVKTFSYW